MTTVYPDLDCSVPGCERPVMHSARYVGRRGYKGPGVPMCHRHYSRWRYHGDPTVDLRPHGITHGCIATYNDGCRCVPCTGAAREHRAKMRSAHRTEGAHGCAFCDDRFDTSRGRWLHENKHTRDINGRISA